jgi:3',5'-cyclic AMP phosphodiesterase CpdA
LANFDTPGATAGAFRPQDSHECHILNASVKTLNAVHAKTPLSFVLLGGDNADSAQQNEVDWLMQVLSGAERVECDSGANDDPVPGAYNDGKDPFQAPGLDVPWLWVTGNHDILVQGNLPVTADKDTEAMGEDAVGGTRDWSQAGGPLFTGPAVADSARHLLSRTDLLSRVAGDSDGHGLSSTVVASSKAVYTYDVPDSDLRFLILDTAAETGGSDGLLRQGDVDTLIVPLLDKASSDGKVVALASHHATSSLGDGSGLGGKQQPDALGETDWLSVLASYPNVLFSFVGHSHENRMRYLQTGSSTGFWEVMTSALADYPHQMRIVEIWQHEQGWYALKATNVDYSTEGDAVAAEGRRLGVLDWVAGWIPAESTGTADDRNTMVWIQRP